MAQSALNGAIELPTDTWVLFSEIDCTFVSLDGPIEVIGMDGEAPGAGDVGIIYERGKGETVSNGTLAMFAGAGTADRLYAISHGVGRRIFVSRAAVA